MTLRLDRYADQSGSIFRFDSSKGRGAFKTEIGVGKVIKGTSHLGQGIENIQSIDRYKAGMRAWQR